MNFDIIRSNVNLNFHFKLVQGMTLILILYIDDLLLTSSGPLVINHKKDFGLRYTSRDKNLYTLMIIGLNALSYFG